MRSKSASLIFFFSIIQQIIAAICGLIVPRLFIGFYGSEVNGLISSINQFLSYITLLEGGLTGVVMALLYKPIARKNENEINILLANARSFFGNMAIIYIIYVAILSMVYPILINTGFSKSFITSLVMIMSVPLLVQYLIGIVNNIFIQASQKMYVVCIIQTISTLLTAINIYICIVLKMDIRVLKLLTIITVLINPVGYFIYVKKHYNIDDKIKGSAKNIPQWKDGMYQHVCYFIQNNIDVMVLTFVDLKLVSVYSVYYMIISMIRKFFQSFVNSFKSALGDLIAHNESKRLKDVFSLFEFLLINSISIIFISLAFSLMPFIKLYTSGIKDINYVRPIFGYIMILAEAIFLIRYPYNTLVGALGHFKQTRNSAIVEAGINLILSVVLVIHYGIVGVAIGTLFSCLFRTIYYVIYLKDSILNLSVTKFIFRIGLNIILVCISGVLFGMLNLKASNYLQWLVIGCIYIALSGVIIMLPNCLIFKTDYKLLKEKINGMIK